MPVKESILDRLYSMQGGPDECRGIYGDWAESYESDTLEGMGYVGPKVAAMALAKLADPAAPVLDAGCGTGLVGAELSGQGFQTVDGIDLSQKMLDIAKRKDVYRSLQTADMTAPLDLPSDSYGGVICVGVFTNGHVGPEGFDELARVARPGAPLVASVHEQVWEAQGFRARLEAHEQLRLLEAIDAPYHEKAGYRCRLCILEAV